MIASHSYTKSLFSRTCVFVSYLTIVFVLFLVTSASAQLKPKQLRMEVLQNKQIQEIKPAKTSKNKKKPKPSFNANPKPLAPVLNPLSDAKSVVVLENAEQLSFDMNFKPDAQILRGKVRFRHDNALMYCDSAYFYQKANSLDAFGNVRIVQGDTLFVYGDMLFYDGNIKLAKLRHNVRMVNRKTTLRTDSLNYDRASNLAYYFTGGQIVDELNTLTSWWGQYSPSSKVALFQQNVRLLNNNFILDSDTLRYNTHSNVAEIVGPTKIVYEKETTIHSNKGWYNTATERMMLLNRSEVIQKDGKTLTGDTIYYDKKMKFGESFSKVVLTDTLLKNTLIGYYVNYDEKKQIGIANDSAMFVDWSSEDMFYLHADTLTTYKDSIYDAVRGNYGVRFYKSDLQGLCDSLAYSSRDSLLHLHGQPVLWSDNNQLSGNLIQAKMINGAVRKIFIQKGAMVIQQHDSIHFNQLSGKDIIAYVDSSELRRLHVNGNAETLYFPVDDADSSMVGMNATQSSYVTMYLKKKKVDRIVLTSASTGTMCPIEGLVPEKMFLKNFFWLDDHRPRSREEIFSVFPKKSRPTYSDWLSRFSLPKSSFPDNKPHKATTATPVKK